MPKKRKAAKKAGMTLFGIGVGTVVLLTAGGVATWSWWREKGKREALEKQVVGLGVQPVTAVNGNPNGTNMAAWG